MTCSVPTIQFRARHRLVKYLLLYFDCLSVAPPGVGGQAWCWERISISLFFILLAHRVPTPLALGPLLLGRVFCRKVDVSCFERVNYFGPWSGVSVSVLV